MPRNRSEVIFNIYQLEFLTGTVTIAEDSYLKTYQRDYTKPSRQVVESESHFYASDNELQTVVPARGKRCTVGNSKLIKDCHVAFATLDRQRR